MNRRRKRDSSTVTSVPNPPRKTGGPQRMRPELPDRVRALSARVHQSYWLYAAQLLLKTLEPKGEVA
jgi:hypothetical protein